ncbi:VWA domain-containing protein [Aliarcobacter lanthieri]|uniref:VWA domain-containing protein n=1 Tax=Aliarcobacter lanthieri TaxID=1355374 RepID=UPI003AFA58A9
MINQVYMNKEFIHKETIKIRDDLIKDYSVLKDDRVKANLDNELLEWKNFVAEIIKTNSPFIENKNQLTNSKEELERDIFTIQRIKNDFSNYLNLRKIAKSNIKDKYWNSEIERLERLKSKEKIPESNKLKIVNKINKTKSLNEELLLSRKYLLQQWQKTLSEEYLKWELNEINRFRNELFKKLKNWLDLLEKINKTLSDLSIEYGLLFDLSNENISLQDIEELKKWLKYISKTKGIKELCDLLGKLRMAEKSTKQEIIKSITHIEETKIDVNSKEEIVGIKLGKDIEHVIPEELALLSDEETSILFDLKYIEGRLLCFDMEGIQNNLLEIEEEQTISSSEEEKLGPIIICVDTSASMSGSPETIAKAVSLYLATRAKNQNRDCYLIDFSTSIETINITDNMGLKELLHFLSKSFYGGTDVEPALIHALDVLKKDNYKKSDILVISDFIMGSLSDTLIKNIKEIKKSNNSLYSLVIGDLFLNQKNREIYDNEWVYNPYYNSINNIKNIIDEIIT